MKEGARYKQGVVITPHSHKQSNQATEGIKCGKTTLLKRAIGTPGFFPQSSNMWPSIIFMRALVPRLHPGGGGGRHSRGDCWISSLRLGGIAATSLAPDLWPAADLRGRNMVMGDWLSTVSYWHLTKCREQNEFTPLFLNHQQARAGLLP